MRFKPRLIPAVIAAATILLGIKVSDILSGNFASDAEAKAPATAPGVLRAIPDAKANGAPVDFSSIANALARVSPAAEAPPKTAAAEAPGSAAPPPQSPANKAASGAVPAPNSAAAQAPPPNARVVSPALPTGEAASKPAHPVKDPSLLSPAEIEVLQQLAERRAALDQRANDLDQQKVVMQAAEKRIDDKIAELQKLQKSIESEVEKQTQQDDARTQSLVKIYETMKPQDAAQILGQLDMSIALTVLTRMKELKTAPILAAMTPSRAQAITAALAQNRDQPAGAASGGAANAGAAALPPKR